MDIETLKDYLLYCHIRLDYSDDFIFKSLKERFEDFGLKSTIKYWDANDGKISLNGSEIVFPNTFIRIIFANNCVMLIFKSGHIRFMSGNGFKYYALLTNQKLPDFIQGDLVVIELDNDGAAANCNQLNEMLKNYQKVFWHTSVFNGQHRLMQDWTTASELFIGGNQKHRSQGLLCYFHPVDYDHRTVQIKTIEKIALIHDPVDDLHPTCYLEKNRNYLISKMSGYSNPVSEANSEIINGLYRA